MPSFDLRSAHVGFVVNKVAMGHATYEQRVTKETDPQKYTLIIK